MVFIKEISGLSKAMQEAAIEELLDSPKGHHEIEHSDAFILQASTTHAQPIRVDDIHVESFKVGPNKVTGTFRYFASGKQQENKPDHGRGLYGLGDFTIEAESIRVTNLSASINFAAEDD